MLGVLMKMDKVMLQVEHIGQMWRQNRFNGGSGGIRPIQIDINFGIHLLTFPSVPILHPTLPIPI